MQKEVITVVRYITSVFVIRERLNKTESLIFYRVIHFRITIKNYIAIYKNIYHMAHLY